MIFKSTLIIAEAGVNHNGDMEIARKLIDAAADAKADLVKFQTFKADRLVTEIAAKAGYQTHSTDAAESHYNMIRKLELNREMHEDLISYCKSRKIGFFSTGFDNDSLDMLVDLGLKIIKIPSGEITNLPYLRHVGSLLKPVIISTGMASLGEIEDALLVLEDTGLSRKNICVLHCNTEYPTPIQDVNLRAMLSIRQAFKVDVGYSDHTMGIAVPIAAVALGAKVIEKHLTLDRRLPGPDHCASLEPAEFADMVKSIRQTEEALGNGIKRASFSESKNKTVVRKSLVAATAINAGELFTEYNIAVKRPGTGISPMRWDEVVGRSAPRNFDLDDLIEL
jgi:N,N'-diacetyllegionaminate synthase